MNKQKNREILNGILLDTDRISHFNDIISEIGDDLESSNKYIINKSDSLIFFIKNIEKILKTKNKEKKLEFLKKLEKYLKK